MKFIAFFLIFFSLEVLTEPYNMSQVPSETDTTAYSFSFRPCRSWSYQFDVHGYVCNYPDTSVTVPSYYEYEALERRVRALEEQIKLLKQK